MVFVENIEHGVCRVETCISEQGGVSEVSALVCMFHMIGTPSTGMGKRSALWELVLGTVTNLFIITLTM